MTKALRDGATLILNAAQDASPNLRDLCESLAAEFACVCQANLYACWRSRPGFDVHWDDHDVIVVQAEGRKRWSLYGATREAPLVRGDPADHRPPSSSGQDLVLEAGDVLYLPRGVWHAALGVDEPSLHLTIGLTRRTGADFFHWLADTLAEEALVRRDLPFEEGERALANRLSDLLALAAQADPADLARRYRRDLDAAYRAAPRLSFPAIGGVDTTPSEQDEVWLAPGPASLAPADASGAVVLSWRGDRFTISGRLQRVLSQLVSGQAVRFGDLAACAEPEETLTFVREMVRRGVFLLRGAPGGREV
ncbi:JmjC domain-containing protein [Phenylobacterium sp.]|uniref:JmjC domain-containing protein n=1 Tax=Phenylobacterium sp. TaxID=1871053 RepID=UPI002E31E8A3|nr:cupin domain-containing protein [Phenylobacterium sp.]HEX2559179.1 cupin domain-containing protein [Phenylobacterium sp.]